MPLALLIPLGAAVIGSMLAAAVLVRDPGQRANRLLAAILVAASWWSLCEVISNLQSDAQAAVRVLRLSALGWLWFGPLAIELVVELAGTNLHARVRRWLQASWGLSGVCAVLYAATPWGLAQGVPTGWGGYSFRFGPLFLLPYLLTVGQVGLALVSWPRVFSGVGAADRRHATWLFVGFSVPVLVASITAPAAEPKSDAASPSVLRHIVTFKFKADATPAQIKNVLDEFKALPKRIPEIHAFEMGTNVSPEKRDKGFTHAFIVTFKTEKDRDAYLVHAAHEAFVKVALPIIEDVFVIDFWTGKL